MSMGSPHVSVLPAETLAALALCDGDLLVDGTFGAGGHSRRALDAVACKVIALDRDPSAIATGSILLEKYGTRLSLIEGRFSDMETLLAREGVSQVDAILLDIGVSSMHLDHAERGFSFQKDGPLDMRMAADGMSAADIVNGWSEEAIANAIYEFGEEPKSRRVARAIVAARKSAPILRTLALAEIVRAALGGRAGPKDPATKTFQALRIVVNDELGELTAALGAAERLLKPGGRLVVISFHSLEDRIVKNFLKSRSGAIPGGSRHAPVVDVNKIAPTFTRVSKTIRATDAEISENPRARSATLRAAVRTRAPAWESH
jgi:16S rRNA (cytosine1402-N4)-methyltransferase